MELGDDLLSGNYKFDGLGYVMDKPLSQLLANGWSLADDAPITFPFSIINCQDILFDKRKNKNIIKITTHPLGGGG